MPLNILLVEFILDTAFTVHLKNSKVRSKFLCFFFSNFYGFNVDFSPSVSTILLNSYKLSPVFSSNHQIMCEIQGYRYICFYKNCKTTIKIWKMWMTLKSLLLDTAKQLCVLFWVIASLGCFVSLRSLLLKCTLWLKHKFSTSKDR